jgi:hypothetical protein
MRKILGCVFLALGVALIVLAIALPTYVYPRATKMLVNPNAVLIAKGDGMHVLLAQADSVGGIREISIASVTVSRRVTGGIQPDGQRPPKGNAFYKIAFDVNVADQLNGTLTANVEGFSLDSPSGLANNCCGDFLSTSKDDPRGKQITHQGYEFKLPFKAQKHDYPFWDVNLGKAVPAHYAGTDELDGLTVYRYVQPIADTVIGHQVAPAWLFGQPVSPTAPPANVSAEMHYANVRTLWFEPRTGALIKGSEKINQRLVADGASAPVLQGTLTYDDATVKSQVDKFKDKAAGLKFISTTGPILGWVLGVIFILLSAALLYLERQRSLGNRDEDRGTRDELTSQSAP